MKQKLSSSSITMKVKKTTIKTLKMILWAYLIILTTGMVLLALR